MTSKINQTNKTGRKNKNKKITAKNDANYKLRIEIHSPKKKNRTNPDHMIHHRQRHVHPLRPIASLRSCTAPQTKKNRDGVTGHPCKASWSRNKNGFEQIGAHRAIKVGMCCHNTAKTCHHQRQSIVC